MSPSFLNHYLQGMGFHVIYDPLATEFFGELPISIWESSPATVASQNACYFPVGHISYSPWVEKWNCGILIRCPVNMANPCLDSYLYKRKSANIQNMVYLGC